MRVYPTKVDSWLTVLILGTILFNLVMGIMVYQYSRVGGFICFGVIGFLILLLSLFLPCRYTMFDDHLLIQSGILKKRIKYEDILSFEKSFNLLAAPAFSLKRVKIKLRKGFALVSPKDRDDFILELERKTE
ncbi:MAG TPA: hypothetical protein EYN68_02880 [Candidatus Marinimicrobia bacterium]|nr:hypothetical protein [Candidatus Neomarinimicrobiota bacterium]